MIGGWLLLVAVDDWRWASQPVIRAFYDHDQLRDPHDKDGLFHAPAFDRFKGLSLVKARRQLERAGLSCDPLGTASDTTACTYGYETQTGCCRFRVILTYKQQIVTNARGDKTGRCPR